MQEKSAIVTPNKRLSRHLYKQAYKEVSWQNKSTWYSPKILPITSWLINCWQECNDQRILLNTLQEKLLWQKILMETLGENFGSLVHLAMECHKLINEWQITTNLFTNETEDITTFKNICEKFNNYCKNNNLVTLNELPILIIPYLADYKFKKISFVGFEEYNPQLQTLINAIEKTGCEVIKIDPNNHENSIQKRLGFNSLDQEIIASAEWAKKLIHNNHKTNVGIVIPNLMELRPKIIQIFTQVLNDTKNINISIGTPLKTIPITSCALELLSLNEPFDLKTISNVLLTPYILKSTTEGSERFLLNSYLQQIEHPHINLNDLSPLAKKYKKNITLITEILPKWQNLFLTTQDKTLHNTKWVDIFIKILQLFGWPGENDLTPIETMAVKYFIQSLQQVAASSLIIEKNSIKKALQILRETIADAILPQDTEIDAPINIMGSLEAAGINFDYLWVMGLDEENWPTSAKPNPFLPIALQKKLFLPHSSAERELHFSKNLINRYKRSAQEIIFSYVTQVDDRSILPSLLITDIPEISIDDLNLATTIFWPEKIYQSQNLETLTNDPAPKLAIDELEHAPSRLIELQSLCPFRAFIEFRLKTKEPIKPSIGISKINRGILIHSALEYFWQKVKTKQHLCQLEPLELHTLIGTSIEQALNQLSLNKSLYELEKKCLLSLLTDWLAIEKERSPFKVIATEKSVTINLATFPIKLRIDRIDQLDDGKILLIDYKTGKNLPTILDWFGPRPKNIQLLLYSLTIDGVEGLALVQINTGATKLKEISLKELIFGLHTIDPQNNLKNNITWKELIKYWHNILTKIALDFASGEATVAPLSPHVCKQCSFGPICRGQVLH